MNRRYSVLSFPPMPTALMINSCHKWMWQCLCKLCPGSGEGRWRCALMNNRALINSVGVYNKSILVCFDCTDKNFAAWTAPEVFPFQGILTHFLVLSECSFSVRKPNHNKKKKQKPYPCRHSPILINRDLHLPRLMHCFKIPVTWMLDSS